MQINAIGATSLQRAAETREGWTVPPGLLRRTANVSSMPRLSAATIEALRRSAGDEWAARSKNPKVKGTSVTYKRVDGELFGRKGPTAKDVVQGRLGDCYFLASVAAVVAEEPDAIQRAIKDNRDGTYEKDGETMVRVRNPWGSTEPDEAVDDGKDDGVFDIALDDLRDQIRGVHTNEPHPSATLDIFDIFHRLFN